MVRVTFCRTPKPAPKAAAPIRTSVVEPVAARAGRPETARIRPGASRVDWPWRSPRRPAIQRAAVETAGWTNSTIGATPAATASGTKVTRTPAAEVQAAKISGRRQPGERPGRPSWPAMSVAGRNGRANRASNGAAAVAAKTGGEAERGGGHTAGGG